MYYYFYYEPYIVISGYAFCSEPGFGSERTNMNDRLKNALKHVNELYADDIGAKFVVTGATHFQGILAKGERIMHLLTWIRQEMYPWNVHMGIGVGEITTVINQKMAVEADGSAVDLAHKALMFIENQQKKKRIPSLGRCYMRLEVEVDNQAITRFINTTLSYLHMIEGNWTQHQREVIMRALFYSDSQQDLANYYHVKQPAIQKTLASGNYYLYMDGIRIIEEALGEIRQK